MRALPHRLAAVWFADIVGYGRLSSRNENEALHFVQLFQRACRDVVGDLDGRIVKFMGDAALAEFASTEAAVRAACALETAFHHEATVSGLSPPRLHVGVHVGEIATGPDGDLYGEGLNLASRLQTLAGPGEVFTSQDVHRQLHHRPEFEFEALGHRLIKDSDDPVPVFRVTSRAGAEASSPPGVRRGVRRRLERFLAESPRVRTRVLALALVVVLAGIAGAVWVARSPADAGSPDFPANRLAVLYFQDNSPGEALGYLTDGLTESLIHELSGVRGLEVVSRNGVRPFRGANVPPDSVARALGVGTLVEGSVSESNGRLRVLVQLVDGPTGTVLESHEVERSRGELFALQDDLTQRVGDFLRRHLGEEIELAELRAETGSLPAWEDVQQARLLREQAIPLVQAGALTEAAGLYDRADSLLVRAQRADSTWVRPITQRGWLAYERSRWTENNDMESSLRWNEVASRHAEAALRVSPRDPEALDLHGSVGVWRAILVPEADPDRAQAQLESAEENLRAAIETDPTQAGAWSRLSWALAAGGDREGAKEAARRAYEADAYLAEADEILWRLFAMSFDLNQPEEAQQWCAEGAGRFPEDAMFVACRIWLLTMPAAVVEPDSVWRLVDLYDRLVPPHETDRRQTMRMVAAAALARAGLPDSALSVAARSRGADTDLALDLANFEAFVRTIAGDEAGAVARLDSYLKASPAQRREVAVTWWFEPLHDRTDFRALVEEPGSARAP
jgi:class 3 adenylate cyclase/TolB-like protein